MAELPTFRFTCSYITAMNNCIYSITAVLGTTWGCFLYTFVIHGLAFSIVLFVPFNAMGFFITSNQKQCGEQS